MNYQWNWSSFFDLSLNGKHTYLQGFLIGTSWTVSLAALTILFALSIGFVVATMRISRIPAASWLAIGFVEYQRNIPLIAHIFLWYYVLPELVPNDIGLQIKRMPQPWGSFLPAVICLSLYGAARMSEVIRAGVQSLPRGQFNAATAIGLTETQMLRYVIFPQAMRIVLPAMTSEFVSAVKYSSVAFSIGLLEVMAQTKSMQEYTFQIFEAFIVAGAIYMTINWALIFCMRAVGRRIAMPGYLGSDNGREA